MLRAALLSCITAIGGLLVAVQCAFAQPINLTRQFGVTASASSIRDLPDGPENVIDGNRSSRIGTAATEYIWHSTPTSAAFPAGYNTQFQSLWLEVDLGSDFYLDRVQVFSRLSASSFTTRFYAAAQHLIQNFHIDVYNSAGDTVFSKGYLAGKSTDDEPWAASDMRNIIGRKVRITRDPRHNIVGNLANSAMAMAEFEVWGQPTPILQNLAKNGTVTATAANTLGTVTTPASAAIDGNLSGHFWHSSIYESSTAGGAPYSGPFGNGHYWQVELPQLSTINYVTIFARTDGEPSGYQAAGAWAAGVTDFRNGQIRISILGADGSTVVTSKDTTLGGDDFDMQRYDLTTLFETNPLGKFVRVESLDLTKTLTFGEVEVFGTPSGSGSGLAIPEPVLTGPLAALAFASLTLRRRSKSYFTQSSPCAIGFAVLLAMGMLPSAVHAVPTNLSVAGTTTATASSQLNANNTPAKARDGNRSGVGDANSFWHSANAPVPEVYGMQHWYEIDLGSNFYLDRLQIFPRPGSSQYQDTIKNFKLEVYNSAGTTVFSQMFLPDKTTGDRSWGTNAIRNVVGSRVRIIRDPPHAQWDRAMTFGEFEVWGQSSPITANLALNRPTTSSPPLPVPVAAGPTGPELANDGDIAGHFWLESVFLSDNSGGAPYTGPYGNGQFWQTQLAQPSAISYVNLFARSDDFTQNGLVRVSIVGADATTIVASADVDLSVLDSNLSRYNFTQVFASNPVGSFVRVESLDTSKVLTLAEVEVFGPAAAGVPGDYNGNGIVDGADYVVWRKNNGLTGGATTAQGDGTGDGNVNAADYTYWRTRFGNTSGSGSSLGGSAVPEPTSAGLLLMATVFCWPCRASR